MESRISVAFTEEEAEEVVAELNRIFVIELAPETNILVKLRNILRKELDLRHPERMPF